MMIAKFIAVAAVFTLTIASSTGQTKAAEAATAPPKMLVLVYQRFSFDKASDREEWELAMTRACQNLALPNSWIMLQAVSGEPEALSFDAFESFAAMEKPGAEWGAIYAAHPELARLQAQINAALTSQRNVIAVRRDDLSYRQNRIDLSKARFLRIVEVRLHPGREKEFAEALQGLSAAYEKIDSLPWVIYQVNLGMPSPTFLALVPMTALGQNDDFLKSQAESESAMQQMAREAYERVESNLYSVRPDQSHVSKEFAAGDPEFWTPKPQVTAAPERKHSRQP
jgi:hypothetical protein